MIQALAGDDWQNTKPTPEDSPVEARHVTHQTGATVHYSKVYRLYWDPVGNDWSKAAPDAWPIARWDDTQWRPSRPALPPSALDGADADRQRAYSLSCHQIRQAAGEIVDRVKSWPTMGASNAEDAKKARWVIEDLDAIMRRYFESEDPAEVDYYHPDHDSDRSEDRILAEMGDKARAALGWRAIDKGDRVEAGDRIHSPYDELVILRHGGDCADFDDGDTWTVDAMARAGGWEILKATREAPE